MLAFRIRLTPASGCGKRNSAIPAGASRLLFYVYHRRMPLPRHPLHAACLGALLCLSPAARAELPDPLPALSEAGMEQADATRDFVSRNFVRLVTGIDRFFGDEREFQESNRSVLQLDLNERLQPDGQRATSLSGRAKLHLPMTEYRFHLLLESDPEQNTTGAATPNQPQRIGQIDTPGEYGLALRLEESEEQQWHTSTDVGIKLQTPFEPFARARASLTLPLGADWRMKPAQSLFWFSQSGLGETTQVDFERALAPQTLFRATSSATWLHLPQRFDLRQDLTVYHTLDERRALQYQFSLIGVSAPQSRLDDAILSALYRRQLNRRWLFFELNPQLHFPHETGYSLEPLLWLRLQVLLDEE